MFTPIPNHIEQAQARLIQQYATAPNFLNLLAALIDPAQTIENVLNDLNTLRTLDTAFGQTLDNIGTIVGLARLYGQTDDSYRQALYVRIGINLSEGQPNRVIQTFQTYTGENVLIYNEYRGEFMIESALAYPTQADVDATLEIMSEVAPVGVRCDGFVTYDPLTPFAFDGTLFGAGWGDELDPTQGGLWSIYRTRDGEFAFAGSDSSAEGWGSIQDPLVGGEFIS